MQEQLADGARGDDAVGAAPAGTDDDGARPVPVGELVEHARGRGTRDRDRLDLLAGQRRELPPAALDLGADRSGRGANKVASRGSLDVASASHEASVSASRAWSGASGRCRR